jgi:hypothetical protein
LKYVFLLFLLVACENKEANQKYDTFYKTNLEADKKCDEFEDSLKKYIVETETEDLFVKEETKALEAINNFKMELTSRKRVTEANRLIFTACSSKKSGERLISCPTQIDFMVFFGALLKAAGSYSWSSETKHKAAHLAGSFLRYQLNEPQDLMSVSILTDLMRRIQDNDFMKKDILNELSSIEEELGKIRAERRQTAKEALNAECEEVLKRKDEEAIIAARFIEKLRKFVPHLP